MHHRMHPKEAVLQSKNKVLSYFTLEVIMINICRSPEFSGGHFLLYLREVGITI